MQLAGSALCSSSGGAVPGGAVPGGAVPRGAVPGGAVPGGAVPGGAERERLLDTFSRRVRALVFNLRDTKTPELRRRVIDGEREHRAARHNARATALVCDGLPAAKQEIVRRSRRSTPRAWKVRSGAMRACSGTSSTCTCAMSAASNRVSETLHGCRAGPAQRRTWTISVVVDRAKSYATCCECKARWEI